MKTMTCRQMGGPCDTPIHGNTPDEMIADGAMHVQAEATKGDVAHQDVLKMMGEMQTNPDTPENRAWTEKFMADFAAQPEDTNSL